VPIVDRTGYDSAPGISLNMHSSTALHLAAANSHVDCVAYLCQSFPHTIDWADKDGMTALMLAARSSNQARSTTASSAGLPRPLSTGTAEDTTTISTLLAHNASLACRDSEGNTALHHASAWGNLKAVRVLLEAGSPGLPLNRAKHTPLDYSITSQAARYFQSLIAEFERAGAAGSGDEQDHRSPARATSPVETRQTRIFHGDPLSANVNSPSVRLVMDSESEGGPEF
jgi:uncharacterized protein